MSSNQNAGRSAGSSVSKRTTTNPDGTRTVVTTTTTPSPGGGSVKKTTTENLPSLPVVRREQYNRSDGSIGWKRTTTITYPGGRREVKTEYEGGSRPSAASTTASPVSASRSSADAAAKSKAKAAKEVELVQEVGPPIQSFVPGIDDKTKEKQKMSSGAASAAVSMSSSSPTKKAFGVTSGFAGPRPEINTDDAAPLPPGAYDVSNTEMENKKELKKTIASRDPLPPTPADTIVASSFTKASKGPEINTDDSAPLPPGAYDMSHTADTRKKKSEKPRGEDSYFSPQPNETTPSKTENFEPNQLNEPVRSTAEQEVRSHETTAHQVPNQASNGNANAGNNMSDLDYVVPNATLVQSNQNVQGYQYQRTAEDHLPQYSQQTPVQSHGPFQSQQPQAQIQPPQPPDQFESVEAVPMPEPSPPPPQNNRKWLFGGIGVGVVIVVAVVVGVVVASTQRGSETTTTEENINLGDMYPDANPEPNQPETDPNPSDGSSFPPEEYNTQFCAGMDEDFELCYAGECIGDDSCACELYTRNIETEEVGAICRTCTACNDGTFAADCNNFGGGTIECGGGSSSTIVESSFPPEEYDTRFCMNMDATNEFCFAGECIGDESCQCELYYQDITTKEINGICNQCSVCSDGSFASDCSNLGADEVGCEVASSSNSDSSLSIPEGYDYFTYCEPGDMELCVALECINDASCGCVMYEQDPESKEITGICSYCNLCGSGSDIGSFSAGCTNIGYGTVECDDYSTSTPAPGASPFSTPRPTNRPTPSPGASPGAYSSRRPTTYYSTWRPTGYRSWMPT